MPLRGPFSAFSRIRVVSLREIMTGPVYLMIRETEDGEELYTVAPQNSPLVAIDGNGLDRLRRVARQEADASGRTVSIICFTERSIHETFAPSTTEGDN